MILAFVGSGGKTTRIREVAAQYRAEGKRVFVTTTTHMFREADTLLTDDPEVILARLKETGYAMAGIPEGEKIKALSRETYEAVCPHADVVLVEADGSKRMPLKYPNETEPMIPENVQQIIVLCGLNALGQPAKAVCHRLELVKECLSIGEDTVITPAHIQKLVTEGYLRPLRDRYPNKKISLLPRHDGSLYQRALAAVLAQESDVTLLRPEWFCPQPKLVICGGGHVAQAVAAMAAQLDFYTKVIDDRPEIMTRENFPTAEEVICDDYENLTKYMEPGGCYVVVTPFHRADYRCVSSILASDYAYLGMIGSRRKVNAALEKLREDGFSEEQVGSIFAPIGLPIGAVTPAEIALSILAQIIQEKNKTHAASADRSLLEVREKGVLCVITAKHGSAPRGVGSMMFVGENSVLGSIGGGESEFLAIRRARESSHVHVETYRLDHGGSEGLDMVCGGTIDVLFIPI